MIPQDIVDRVREAADVVDVVSRLVTLKRSGARMVGLCPFHNEKSPSFTVSPQRGRYHCFGCGAQGDALQFLMEAQGLDFVEAVKALASQVGVIIPEGERESAQAREQAARHQVLFELLAQVHARFEAALEVEFSKEASPVAAYCASRGVSLEVARRHRLGWVERGALRDLLASRASALRECGLAVEVDDQRAPPGSVATKRLVELFRSRLMFPISDEKGRVVAFGGRHVDVGGVAPGVRIPKYVNSPETELYRKSEVLYRLAQARQSIHRRRRALVVEGYMDALSLAEFGIDEALACCGTALTLPQLNKVLKIAESVYFVFDGDAAGVKAAVSASRLCAQAYRDDRQFRFLILPDGLDPDEFLRSRGAEAFEECLRAAQSLSEFVMGRAIADHGGLRTVEQRSAFLRAIKLFAATLPQGSAYAKLLVQEAYSRSFDRGRPSSGLDRTARPVGARVPGVPHAAPMVSRFGGDARPAMAARDLWQELTQAVAVAPGVAKAVAVELKGLLDIQDPAEAGLAAALESALQAHGELPADDAVRADLLRAAPRLIAKKRLDAALESLKKMRKEGAMTEEEYLAASVALMTNIH